MYAYAKFKINGYQENLPLGYQKYIHIEESATFKIGRL